MLVAAATSLSTAEIEAALSEAYRINLTAKGHSNHDPYRHFLQPESQARS